jgi:8-oxo-dGTP pyrophosphatase MutT (NUDIX family)
MSDVWAPSVTVAAVIMRGNRFLLVEEETSQGICINQPAGHLEPLESLEDAVIRETLEETAHDFTPTALVGMYMSRYLSSRTQSQVTYLRFTFCGEVGKLHDQPLDTGILRTLWLTYDEIVACRDRHRSSFVLQCVEDYLKGQRVPLALLHTHLSVFG